MKKKSSLLDSPPQYGDKNWGLYQYERMKEANRGHNYRYYNDTWWKEMESKGWNMAPIPVKNGGYEYWTHETHAKEMVEAYRKTGHYARIICGYHQVKQRIKYYTIIYKKK